MGCSASVHVDTTKQPNRDAFLKKMREKVVHVGQDDIKESLEDMQFKSSQSQTFLFDENRRRRLSKLLAAQGKPEHTIRAVM